MFGSKNNALIEEKDARIAELEQEIAKLKEQLKIGETELESVNVSTHLGIWK